MESTGTFKQRKVSSNPFWLVSESVKKSCEGKFACLHEWLSFHPGASCAQVTFVEEGVDLEKVAAAGGDPLWWLDSSDRANPRYVFLYFGGNILQFSRINTCSLSCCFYVHTHACITRRYRPYGVEESGALASGRAKL